MRGGIGPPFARCPRQVVDDPVRSDSASGAARGSCRSVRGPHSGFRLGRKRAKPRPSAEAGTVPGSSRTTVTPESEVSTYDVEQVRQRLTQERLSSYLAAAGNDADHALALYDWNTRASGCFYEELGRVEVVLRNTFDAALVALGQERSWTTVWYRRASLFQGRQGARALDDIEVARRRPTRDGRAETHGRVISRSSSWGPAVAAVPFTCQ